MISTNVEMFLIFPPTLFPARSPYHARLFDFLLPFLSPSRLTLKLSLSQNLEISLPFSFVRLQKCLVSLGAPSVQFFVLLSLYFPVLCAGRNTRSPL